MTTSIYTVVGMTCDHCVAAVTGELGRLDGVTHVDVDLATGAAAFYSKWLRRRLDGSPFPVATAGGLVLTAGLLLAFAAGLLKI